jgi:glycosyltransferase involved in cell wall biosynthesis
MALTIVMVATSYPRFPGDAVGTFMEPIAHGIAARGHVVHLVAPWHPLITRGAREGGVHFHFFRYAPVRSLNVFGYAGALKEDVRLRGSAVLAAPFAVLACWARARRIAREQRADVVHGHWVIPGGAIAAAAAGTAPLVVSLHGSDVYVAERHVLPRWAARYALRRAAWLTACSGDLRDRAVRLGASAARSEVIPYGVDASRFKPDAAERKTRRAGLALPPDAPLILAAGRLVRKKGFEHLVAAMRDILARHPGAHLVVAGGGDLENELRERAAAAGASSAVHLIGPVSQQDVGHWMAAADVVAVPSVRDEAGNVDGLPNVLMEALASGTAVVTTAAGGIGAVVTDGDTARVVPERDPGRLAGAIGDLLASPAARQRLGAAARAAVERAHGWSGVAARFERVYERALGRRGSD